MIDSNPGDIISMKKAPIRIHINQHNIRANACKGEDLPVITIKRGRDNFYAREIEILGPSKVIYSSDGKPLLSCGARVIMETTSQIKVIR
jgi:hypothetical protein